MSSREFFDGLLNRLPGYRGYREKESRRDTDRAIRDRLVVEYTQLADRLGRLATQLANERQIATIALVDRPHKLLVQFIDRIRTATYGYAPIFANDRVDERALEQLIRFDEALADQTAALDAAIRRLEGLDPRSVEFKSAAADVGLIVQGLDDRFDKRGEVIRTGEALPEEDLVALLDKPQRAHTPRAYRLHDGEALTYQGTNYSVIGRVSLESDGGRWRAFQLVGGEGDQWLLVSARAVDPMYWLTRVTPSGDPGGPTLTVGADSYNLVNQLSGEGEVIGKQGSSGRQPIRYYHYQTSGASGDLHVFRLGSTYLSLVGGVVDPLEVDVFSREQ